MTDYEARLTTRITDDTSRRLRLLAAARGERLNRVLVDVLDKALPSREALAAEVKDGSATDDRN